MHHPNKFHRFVSFANTLPHWLGPRLMGMVFRHKVKLAGTTGIQILSTDCRQATFRQKNVRRAQNHIGSVHAAASALLAESCTGFIVGINLPEDKLPLIKRMDLHYVKRASGHMTAKASLTEQQMRLMQEQEKGECSVKVIITDATGIEPVICEMVWAWVPKKPRE